MIKKLIKYIVKTENKKLILRYILISLLGYGFVFSMLYMLVDIILIDKSISFMIAYGVWYGLLYIIQLKFLFQVKHNMNKFIRFCISLLFFYVCANIFYNIGIYLKIHYLIATTITVIILIPFRFFTLKLVVYKDDKV